MKLYLLMIGLAMSISLMAQTDDIRVVFDVTSADTKIHESTMRHVKGMSAAYPDGQFELVVYSGALPMLMPETSTVANEIAEVVKRDNVKIVVCAQTLKRHKKDESVLIEGVTSVPDGIVEIMMKQREGYGYIKEAN